VLGRDILSRLLYGGRVTLLGVVISSAIYLAMGVTLGLLAGYFGGWIDRVVLRLADLVYAVPVIIVLLVVLAIFPGDETAAMVALGLLAAPGLARIVRSVTKGCAPSSTSGPRRRPGCAAGRSCAATSCPAWPAPSSSSSRCSGPARCCSRPDSAFWASACSGPPGAG